jgi:hypothetical protein
VLNKGGRWCSVGEMVPSVRRRDWSRGRIFYGVVGHRKVGGQGEGGSGGGTSMVLLTEDENGEGEAMGVVIFRGEEREEATQLHSAEGRRHNKERAAAKEIEGGG